MTRVARRVQVPLPFPRYQVVRIWDQVGKRYMWCVIDNDIHRWARAANPDGYETEEEAAVICAGLRAKEKT